MADSCCNGTCRRTQPVRVMESPLTGRVYAVLLHRPWGDGIEALEKHDVTTDVRHLLAEAWDAGHDHGTADGQAAEPRPVVNPYREDPRR